MLCRFGQTRNASVAIIFSLFSSFATRSATGGYKAVVERFGQNEEPASLRRNELRTILVLIQNMIKQRTRKSCKFFTCIYAFLLLHLFF